MPFLIAQWLLLILMLLAPSLVHVGENARDSLRGPSTAMPADEIDKRFREMMPLPPEEPQ